ncbi:MAG: ABC transporter permease [Candidatus Woesearchaeota archaeon]
MMQDYLKIATKNLMKKKVRSWLTLIGIFIGIATVVSIISLGQGLEDAVAQQFQAIGAERITISAQGAAGGPPGTNVVNPITQRDIEIIKRTRGVDIAAGQLIESTTLQFGDKTRNSFVTTLPRDTAERNFVISTNNYDIQTGRMIRQDERTKVVLGANFYERTIFERELRLSDEIKINGQTFEIVGFLERAGSFQVDGIIILTEESARTLFNNDNDYAIITVIPTNIQDINLVTERIRENLRKDRGVREGREDFTVQTSQEALDSINDILSVVTYFLLGIAAISILVGGIGVMNTMFTSILERTREIGIMKSIGARNSHILTIFIFESGLLGLAGGIIGLILGMGLGLMVQGIGRLVFGTELIQAIFTLDLIIGSLLFSFLIGAVAGILPAIRASQMKIVDALRQ